MRLKPTRRLAGLALVPALLFGFAACGSDSSNAGGSNASDNTDTSSDTNTSADAAVEAIRPAAGDEVAVADFLGALTSGMESATTAHIVMDAEASGTSISIEGDMDYGDGSPKLAMQMEAVGQSMEFRLIDGTVYVNMGEMSENKFYAVELDDPNSPLGDLSSLTESMDIAASMEKAGDGIQNVTYVGEDSVDGQDTYEYQVTVDPTKVEAPGVTDMTALGTDPLVYNMWLDDENRMSKAEIDMGETGTVNVTMSQWGEPIDVEAPAPSEVTTDLPTP